jgi:uncharacterized repeat protein (TIGR03803 family)
MLSSMIQRASWRAILCAAVCSLQVYAAGTLVIGNPRQKGTGECDPFGCPHLFGLTTYQQVYSKSAFGATVTIQQITFYDTQVRNNGQPAQGTFTFSLSYTTKEPGNLDLNNPSNNISGGSQTFYSGALPALITLPSARLLTISGTPYQYDPSQGNLLLTLTVSGASDQSPPLYMDFALTMAQTSNAYFGTSNGGNDSGGLVTGFSLILPFSSVYNFKGSPDPSNPYSTLVADANGTLYGTSYHGGKNKVGAIFQLTPPAVPGGNWTESVLYSFSGGNDGANPTAGLVMNAGGVLYGATPFGGTGHSGTVFSLAPPASPGGAWTHKVLYNFAGGADAAIPGGCLFLSSDGILYGATYGGGSAGMGAVFKVAPPTFAGSPWTETVLYSFLGGTDGAAPYAGVTMDTAGNLYGTTTGGGSAGLGTVFELSPVGLTGAWSETVLYSFAGGTDAASPMAGVVVGGDGSLYGAATAGGAAGFGAVFQLTPPSSGGWTESLLYSFSGNNGDGDPYAAPLLGGDGSLYGTTAGGGTTGYGTVYQLTPPAAPGGPWTENLLYSFKGGRDGATPYGGLISGPNGTFFGTAVYGGAGSGAVFQVSLVP